MIRDIKFIWRGPVLYFSKLLDDGRGDRINFNRIDFNWTDWEAVPQAGMDLTRVEGVNLLTGHLESFSGRHETKAYLLVDAYSQVYIAVWDHELQSWRGRISVPPPESKLLLAGTRGVHIATLTASANRQAPTPMFLPLPDIYELP